jgi:hypothetical protein
LSPGRRVKRAARRVPFDLRSFLIPWVEYIADEAGDMSKKGKKIKILKIELKKLKAEIKELKSGSRKKKGKRRPKNRDDKKTVAPDAIKAEGPQVKAKDPTQPTVRVAALT